MEIKNLDYSRLLSDVATGVFTLVGIILIIYQFIDINLFSINLSKY
jgi:hypothetical protein